MTFEIRDLPSGLLFKGQLVQKKITAKSRRQLILCFVNTVQDIAELYEYLKYPSAIGDGSYSQNFADPTSLKDMEVYGHLTLAAVVSALKDEVELLSACSFALATPLQEYKFYAETSTEYQKWIGAFTKAFEQISTYDTHQSQILAPTQPVYSNVMYAEPQQAIMQWSRDENDYVNAGQRSLSRNQERRRSQSQPRDAKTTTRQTTYINQANEAYLEDDADKVQYLQPKKSFFGRVKTMFSRKKSTSAIGLSEQTSLHESLRKRSQSMSLGISNNTTDCIS